MVFMVDNPRFDRILTDSCNNDLTQSRIKKTLRTPMRILLVEDDELLGEGTKAGLALQELTVDWVRTRADADCALRTDEFDVLLLDIGLPDGSGLDLVRSLRKRGKTVPILLLTARDAPNDKVAGLDSGADDYVVKPFDLDEICARIRALRRRSTGRSSPEIRHGDLRLDPASHRVTRAGEAVHLPPKEFAVLHILLEYAGETVPRRRLISRLYGTEVKPTGTRSLR